MNDKDFKKMIAVCTAAAVLFVIGAFFINAWCALLLLILAAVLISVFYIFTKKRYDKINALNNYLSLICAGNYDLDIDDNAEGELSILKNNLYKIIILLRSQNDALKKDKRYLADSLADISHQLKTPLTSMMVITDVLKQETDKEKRAEFISIIENQLEKMKWLITTLLKLSKFDAGTITFNMHSHSISAVINQSLKPFLVAMDLKQINLVKDIDDFQLVCDENWSIEAFANIIKNCLEHTEENGELTIKAGSTTIFNQISIKDNGCGISKADLPHIFERFYHCNNSSGESVGIGLSLSKEIINRENGRIEVISEEGKGTEFIIRFYKTVV